MAQSLISDFKALIKVIWGSTKCSDLLEGMVRKVEFLSDASLEIPLKDWNTDAAQRATVLSMPFEKSQ